MLAASGILILTNNPVQLMRCCHHHFDYQTQCLMPCVLRDVECPLSFTFPSLPTTTVPTRAMITVRIRSTVFILNY